MAATEGSAPLSPSARPAALTKDDFSSLGGSYIKLGWHKSNAGSPDMRKFNESFIFHNPHSPTRQQRLADTRSNSTAHASSIAAAGLAGSSSSGCGGSLLTTTHGGFDPQGGLSGTKFGPGFARRGQDAIENRCVLDCCSHHALPKLPLLAPLPLLHSPLHLSPSLTPPCCSPPIPPSRPLRPQRRRRVPRKDGHQGPHQGAAECEQGGRAAATRRQKRLRRDFA